MRQRRAPTLCAANAPDLLASTFVGRSDELRVGIDALERAVAGRGGVLLVGGDAGMGKTRLAEEIASRASEAGVRTHVGRAWDGGGAPPFWPWMQVFGSIVAERGLDALRGAAAGAGPALHPIVPDVFSPTTRPDHQVPSADAIRATPILHDETERFRTLEIAADVLRALAATEPFLIVLDDLHWADAPTTDLLQFVARRASTSSLLAIGTFRQTDLDADTPMASAAPRLARERNTRRLELRGFTLDDIGQLLAVASALDTDVVPRDRELELFERTAGNPFLLRELILLDDPSAERDREDRQLEPPELPALARSVLEARIDRVSPPTRAYLQAASVIGLHFSVGLAAEIQGIDRAAAWRALDEASHAGLVVSPPPGGDEARLAHALLRDVLYASCGARSRALHLAVAEELETAALVRHDRPDALERRSAELAWHFARSGLPDGDHRAITYAVLAAQSALARHDDDTGYVLFRQAESMVQAMDAPPAELVHEALLGGAIAARRAGASDHAERFLAALDIAQGMDDAVRVARTAIAMSEPGVYDDQRVTALRTALAGLDGQDPSDTTGAGNGDDEDDRDADRGRPTDAAFADARLRALVAGQLAEEIATIDPAEGIELAVGAVDVARGLDEPLVLGRALNALRIANWRADRAGEQLAIGTEMLELAEWSGESAIAIDARHTLLVAHQQLGQLTEVNRDATALEQLSTRFHDPTSLAYVQLTRAMTTLAQGRLTDSDRYIREVTSQAERLGHGALGQYALAQSLLLRWERGEVVELDESILDLPDGHELLAVWRCGLTFAACIPGREAGLQARFRGLSPGSFADAPHTFTWLACVALLAGIADFLDAVDEAPLLAELLEPFAGCAVTIGPAVCLGSAAYFAGLAWRTAGQMDRALDALQRAIDDNDCMGARPWAARSRIAFAFLIDATDPERARSLMLDAHDTAEALTLPRLLEESGRALVTARPALPDGLTPREAEVLRGIASGMTNAELADALFVSAKTVERHVANLYRKIGVRNRTEATAYVHRRDLV